MSVWTAAILAVATVIANAAVAYATVKRLEEWQRDKGQDLETLMRWKAVMDDRDKRGGE